LDCRECAADVHLVGEHEDGQVALGPDVLVSEQRLELVARNHQPQPVRRVDYENYALAVFVVVLPQLAVPALSGHIERRETNILVCGKKTMHILIPSDIFHQKEIYI
jgi:hypothetical protein